VARPWRLTSRLIRPPLARKSFVLRSFDWAFLRSLGGSSPDFVVHEKVFSGLGSASSDPWPSWQWAPWLRAPCAPSWQRVRPPPPPRHYPPPRPPFSRPPPCTFNQLANLSLFRLEGAWLHFEGYLELFAHLQVCASVRLRDGRSACAYDLQRQAAASASCAPTERASEAPRSRSV